MTFNPDDPELISLITQCKNDRDTIPVLADWLEEHGFDRDKHEIFLWNRWHGAPPKHSMVSYMVLLRELKRRSVAIVRS